jgi:hypothetical protein
MAFDSSVGTFISSQNPQTVSVPDFVKPTSRESMQVLGKSWQISDTLERWNFTLAGKIDTTMARGHTVFSVAVPHGLMSNEIVQTAFEKFRWWNAGVDFHVKISSTRFNQGRMIVYWVPMYDNDSFIDSAISNNFSRITTLPNVTVDFATMNDAYLRVPFKHIYNNLPCNSSYARLGTLRAVILNPLTSFTSGDIDITFSILTRFVEPVFSTPIPKSSPDIVLYKHLDNPNHRYTSFARASIAAYVHDAYVHRDFDRLRSDIAKYFPNQSVLADAMRDLQSAIDRYVPRVPDVKRYNIRHPRIVIRNEVGIASLAGSMVKDSVVGAGTKLFSDLADLINPFRIFGGGGRRRDFPNKNAQEAALVRHAFGYTANGRQIGFHQRMATDPTVTYELDNPDDIDCMNVDTILKSHNLFDVLKWDSTDAAGHVVATFPISPVGYCRPGGLYLPTSLAFGSNLFYGWSGNIKFSLGIAVNSIATGRLGIAILPGVDVLDASSLTIQQLSSVYNNYADLGNESHDFPFELPFESQTRWKFCSDPYYDYRGSNASMYSAGSVVIYVVNPLRVYDGSPLSCEINVYSSMGSSYNLMGYGNNNCTNFPFRTVPYDDYYTGVKFPDPPLYSMDPGASSLRNEVGSGEIESQAESQDPVPDAPAVPSQSETIDEPGQLIAPGPSGAKDKIEGGTSRVSVDPKCIDNYIKAFSLVTTVVPQYKTVPSADVTGVPVYYALFSNAPGQVLLPPTQGYSVVNTTDTKNYITGGAAGSLGFWSSYFINWSGDLRYKILIGGMTDNRYRAFAFPFSFYDKSFLLADYSFQRQIVGLINSILSVNSTIGGDRRLHNNGTASNFPSFANANLNLTTSADLSYVSSRVSPGWNPSGSAPSTIPAVVNTGSVTPLASCDCNAPYMEIEIPYISVFDRLFVPNESFSVITDPTDAENYSIVNPITATAGGFCVFIVDTMATEIDTDDKFAPSLQIFQAAGDNFKFETPLGPPPMSTALSAQPDSATSAYYPVGAYPNGAYDRTN